MPAEGKGKVLDQFANGDNPRTHIETTGPELWDQTDGHITHFVSAMGTTGTIMVVGSYLQSRNKSIQIVGTQPVEGSQIPGIRKWPEARSEAHTSEPLARILLTYAALCLNKTT